MFLQKERPRDDVQVSKFSFLQNKKRIIVPKKRSKLKNNISADKEKKCLIKKE